MVAHRRVLGRAGEIYVAVCAILAALAILPPVPSYLAHYGLLIATLPVSFVAATITYLGGVLVFGPDLDGLVARTTVFLLWVALATLQMGRRPQAGPIVTWEVSRIAGRGLRRHSFRVFASTESPLNPSSVLRP